MANINARLGRLERASGGTGTGTNFYVVEVPFTWADKGSAADRALREAGIEAVSEDVVIMLDQYRDDETARLVNQWRAKL